MSNVTYGDGGDRFVSSVTCGDGDLCSKGTYSKRKKASKLSDICTVSDVIVHFNKMNCPKED